MRKPDLTTRAQTMISATSASEAAEQPNTTGRHIVAFHRDAVEEGIAVLKAVGLRVAVSSTSGPDVTTENEAGDDDVIIYPMLGVALVDATVEQVEHLTKVASDSGSPLLSIEPEKIRYALPFLNTVASERPPSNSSLLDYLRGYRSAVVHLEAELNNFDRAAFPLPFAASSLPDESRATWGLQATNVVTSSLSGRGIRIAVLDTGFDFNIDTGGTMIFHPDFAGRKFVTKSFTGSATAKDNNGHGTHCVGTACGPANPSNVPRYGIAHEAEIYVGKVLNDQVRGADGWILGGLEWALKNGCQIVSMSLGTPKNPGERFEDIFENVARRALEAGTLIIAAAGNRSDRPVRVAPVEGPADCPSIMAVAALDSNKEVASFSNGGSNPSGAEVDVVAPGVSVFSSFLKPTGHVRKNGTSVATPHVAGIAALYAEASSTARGVELWRLIAGNAQKLPFPSQDVGAGLVQAP